MTSRFSLDPLLSLVNLIGSLENHETALLQILFTPVRSDWAGDILRHVAFPSGESVLGDEPDLPRIANIKTSTPLFAATIRSFGVAHSKSQALNIIREMSRLLIQETKGERNQLIPLANEGYVTSDIGDFRDDGLFLSIANRYSHRMGMILSASELLTLVHPPSRSIKSERLLRQGERVKQAPDLATGNALYLGDNLYQNQKTKITLSNTQRTRHMHLIGASGSGKSTLLLSLITQDIEQGNGVCVIDPHGDLIDDIVERVPESRLKDVILFDPADSEFPIGFNILKANSELEKTLLASDLIATFRRLSTSWGDVMDSILANAILAFVESAKGGTLFELKRFLVEKKFRDEFLETVKDDGVRYFWSHEFPLIKGKPQSSILVRLDTFLRQKLIRNIVCQKEALFDFRKIMDKQKVLLLKLSQGAIGEENSYLLGTLMVSKLHQIALSRQDSTKRPFFTLYMDEFQNFITPSMESILSGVRKFNVSLCLANQEYRQVQSRSPEVASSVISNCYTRVCFRLGDSDAEKFANGFSYFEAKDLQNLGVGEAIARVERAEYDFNLKNIPLI